jgi:hypothetical protein
MDGGSSKELALLDSGGLRAHMGAELVEGEVAGDLAAGAQNLSPTGRQGGDERGNLRLDGDLGWYRGRGGWGGGLT